MISAQKSDAKKRKEQAGLTDVKERRRALIDGVRKGTQRQSNELAQKFYIGLHSPEERKQLFLHYFGSSAGETPPPTIKEALHGPLHRLEVTLQDPYNMDSWHSPAQLENMEAERQLMTRVLTHFPERYTVTNKVEKRSQSATKPVLYDMRSTSDYFHHLLYERDDLFMKIVPLHFVRAQSEEDVAIALAEIYTEIVVAYFLNELVYGYSQVLSLHFMTIVDWFPTQRIAMTPEEQALDEHHYHQIIVSEKLDESLRDYLLVHRSGAALRASLFQMFHALETAWHTNGYTHNDLHLGNIMVKWLGEGTPLHNKDFLYRRLTHDHWFRLRREDLNNSMVKLIDFGRNRLFVASKPSHIDEAGGEHRHVHDQLICAPGFAHAGYACEAPNREIDVVLPLVSLLMLPRDYWDALGEQESRAFFALCELHLDFAELNRLVSAYYWGDTVVYAGISREDVEREFHSAGNRIKASNLHRCPTIYEFMRQTGVFIYRRWVNGSVASDVLNDPYFNAYKTRSLLPLRQLTNEEILDVQNHSAVVSFLAHAEEAEMRQEYTVETMLQSRCDVCNRVNVSLEVAGGERVCNWACYEFRHLFGGKTVYR